MAAVDTKTELMNAAELQVRQKGAEGFSYGDLSTQVGIRKASIHYHFPAKSDLLTKIMERYSDRVLAELGGLNKKLDRADQRLLAFIDFYRSALKDGSALCLCVAFAVNRDALAESTHHSIQTFRRRVLAWLEETIKTGLAESSISGIREVGSEASSILALVEGAQLSARMSYDVACYDRATASLKKQLLGSAVH